MKQQHKICIISHAHLTNNPRVYKEAVALSMAGYDVSVVTIWTSRKLYSSDMEMIESIKINYTNSIDLIPGNLNYFKLIYSKVIRKVSQILSKYVKIELPQALSYNISELLHRAERENADLYIGHNEPGLWAGVELLKRDKSVAFDFEDWYSRDYLVPGRTVNLLSHLEKIALINGSYVSTTSNALASELAKERNCKKPVVIYNAFSLNERKDLKLEVNYSGELRLYWFSQNIGPGRGIEEIISALNLMEKNVSLHLRGNIHKEYNRFLRKKLNKHHKLIIHPTVLPSQIIQSMQDYDLGLSLELNYPPSRNLTVTNKMLHYLLAGLPVIASDTTGQREIFELGEGAVELINLNDPEETAEKIIGLINNPSRLLTMREKAIRISTEKFNWERQEKTLLSAVEKALLN